MWRSSITYLPGELFLRAHGLSPWSPEAIANYVTTAADRNRAALRLIKSNTVHVTYCPDIGGFTDSVRVSIVKGLAEQTGKYPDYWFDLSVLDPIAYAEGNAISPGEYYSWNKISKIAWGESQADYSIVLCEGQELGEVLLLPDGDLEINYPREANTVHIPDLSRIPFWRFRKIVSILYEKEIELYGNIN